MKNAFYALVAASSILAFSGAVQALPDTAKEGGDFGREVGDAASSGGGSTADHASGGKANGEQSNKGGKPSD